METMECTKCKKPHAKLVCSSCKNGTRLIGDAQIARYCSAACQEADWKNHKKTTCTRLQDRTTRVADTAQKLFYIVQELTWSQLEVENILKQGDSLILRANLHRYRTWPRDCRVFPSHLLPLKEDREAVLSFLGCISAGGWMIEFVKGLLDGIVTETTWIECKTKNEKRQMRRCPILEGPIICLPPNTTHEILKLTLLSSETFAVGISGAQHGYHKPVMEWEEYKQTRIREITASYPAPQPLGILQVKDYSFNQMRALYQKIFVEVSEDISSHSLQTRLVSVAALLRR